MTGMQQSLFLSEKARAIVFVCFPDVTEGEFVNAVEHVKPAAVVDLRKAPRFDIGKMSRHLAFEIFRRQGSLYIDLNSGAGSSDDQLLFSIRNTIFAHRQKGKPIMFLVSATQSSSPPLLDFIVECFKGTDEAWEILQVPHRQRQPLRA